MTPLRNTIKIRRLVYEVEQMRIRIKKVQQKMVITKIAQGIQSRKEAIRYLQEYPLRSYTWEHLQEKFGFCYHM